MRANIRKNMPNNSTQNPVRSALMMLAASALFAATAILAKALGQGIGGPALHPFQLSAGRFGFALVTILLVLAVKRPSFHKPAYKTHAIRTLAGWSGVTLMFTAVTLIPISDATAIGFLNPVVAMVLAVLFLGEKVGPIRWLAAAIALFGAMILLRPGLGSFHPAAFFALGAAGFMGLEIVIIKNLSGREAPLQILTINNLMGFVIAITVASFVWINPTALQWLMLAGIGVIMVSGQALFIQSLRAADASFAAPFSYSMLIFATLYDMLIFHTNPDWISVLGGATILSGALMLAWREAFLRKA
jgi:drug/metabolite transporter (DMT)-like permease